MEQTEAKAVAMLRHREKQREVLERARSASPHWIWLVVSMLGMVSLPLAIQFSLHFLTFTAVMAIMAVEIHFMQVHRRIDAVLHILTDQMEASESGPKSK